MNAELDAIYNDVLYMLDRESEADGFAEKRALVDKAINLATGLIQRAPEVADFHYVTGLTWYLHPEKNPQRVTAIRNALRRTLELDPQHQFANQYLGYINFDNGEYSIALKHFQATDHSYFESIGQQWRSLKAIELAIVCQLRLGQDVEMSQLQHFVETYLAEEREQIPNTVVPLELRCCAEWMFDQTDSIEEPLGTIIQFLKDCGDLKRSDHPDFRSALD